MRVVCYNKGTVTKTGVGPSKCNANDEILIVYSPSDGCNTPPATVVTCDRQVHMGYISTNSLETHWSANSKARMAAVIFLVINTN
ncbi:hypothetical protein J6590_073409 [Homalodisca vitripennis]|nr:hypothetical protein J6590_073409 [Homalodisca vitripennis]